MDAYEIPTYENTVVQNETCFIFLVIVVFFLYRIVVADNAFNMKLMKLKCDTFSVLQVLQRKS